MSFRSPKLLKCAEGKPCMLCGDDRSTVACHIRSVALGSGTGIKVPDCLSAWLCQDCHNKVDDRVKCWSEEERRDRWFLAYCRTMVQLFEQGIVKVR